MLSGKAGPRSPVRLLAFAESEFALPLAGNKTGTAFVDVTFEPTSVNAGAIVIRHSFSDPLTEGERRIREGGGNAGQVGARPTGGFTLAVPESVTVG